MRHALILLLICASAVPARAQDSNTAVDPAMQALQQPDEGNALGPPSATRARPLGRFDSTAESMCLLIESAAQANGLPLEFFARVIWQESRFRPNAVGPVTRSGDRAQGIAQFMPRTAAERDLLDPFDPVQALPKSAEFLRELRTEFGNLGLAAAAYNAGPQRVRDWLAGNGYMPAETRGYVAAITGTPVDDWATAKDSLPTRAAPGCRSLMALLRRTPNPFVEQLEQRVKLVALRPWGVQLSAGFSRSKVLSAYARIEKQHGGELAGKDPSIIASTLRSRGSRSFFQVRVGAETRAAAEGVCERIRRRGGACMVLRSPR